MSVTEDFTVEHFTDDTAETEPRLGRFKLPVQHLKSTHKKRGGLTVMQMSSAPALGNAVTGSPRASPVDGGQRGVSRGDPILVQGGSLRTWGYQSPAVEQVQFILSTEGRPLDADVELWHGPDNTPVKCRVYVENGQLRPFSAVLETPRGPNTIAIRNIGQMEFPIAA